MLNVFFFSLFALKLINRTRSSFLHNIYVRSSPRSASSATVSHVTEMRSITLVAKNHTWTLHSILLCGGKRCFIRWIWSYRVWGYRFSLYSCFTSRRIVMKKYEQKYSAKSFTRLSIFFFVDFCVDFRLV